jgi:ADP-heptose:LPS heptosyltransferase
MARGASGESWWALIGRTEAWRSRRYDLAINFEADIRSNLLLGLSGASRRVGLVSGGGGPCLTDPVDADRSEHIALNASRLVSAAFPNARNADRPKDGPHASPRLMVSDEARRYADRLLGRPDRAGALVGIQPAAGRQIKEWDPARFAEVGAELARRGQARIVLIGSASDAHALAGVKRAWPPGLELIELPVETDLVVLTAVLERLALFITGDTGPMHLAAAVGTPVLAIFGPSLPSRYAPLSPRARIVRIDIPCSPCNQLRDPPARCVGHVPDCLAGIDASRVLQVASEMLGSDDVPWAAGQPEASR